MKVCYVLDFFVFKVDGPTINELNFLQQLYEQKNLDVCYFLSDTNRGYFQHEDKEIDFFKDYQNKNLRFLPFYAINAFIKFVFFYYRVKPDIIVTRLGSTPLLHYFISVFFGRKLLLKTVGRFWGEQQSASVKERLILKCLVFINRQILKNARGLDTVTQKFKSIFVSKYKIDHNKISVIENSVDTSKFFIRNSSKTFVGHDFSTYFPILGYVGNVPSKRAAYQLLKIYKPIKYLYPNIAVVVVGVDKELEGLKESLIEASESFFCLGQVPYNSVSEVMNIIDIGYSFTTQHDLQELGNSSQKLRQYIACGKPVITMKTTNDFVENNNLGSLVDQENIQEIVDETIKWIKIVEEQGEALAERLHQYAKEHLSTEKTFQQRLEFWQSILNNEK
jgi:glycosyltransferase involved in cell wall biosynthesis